MLHQKTAESQPYVHHGLHLAKNSSKYDHIRLRMPMVPTSEEEILNILNNFSRTWKVMDVSPLYHKVAYKPWTVVEGSQKTGPFCPTPITKVYTMCSVTGVLVVHIFF